MLSLPSRNPVSLVAVVSGCVMTSIAGTPESALSSVLV